MAVRAICVALSHAVAGVRHTGGAGIYGRMNSGKFKPVIQFNDQKIIIGIHQIMVTVHVILLSVKYI